MLGGGQLARMLSLAAIEMGLSPIVLSERREDPAAQATPNWILGNPHSPSAVAKLAKQTKLITFESEFIEVGSWQRQNNPHLAPCSFFPSLSCMSQLQDRRTQKALLSQYSIPTARYARVDTIADLGKVEPQFPAGCVLKKAFGGYDGYGTFYPKTRADWQAHELDWRGPYIAEEKISFKRELALMFFRNKRGDVTAFPLVESQQKNSKCDLVWGPVKHRDLPRILRSFARLLDGISYTGAMGVELFESPDGLLVNEIAPRVHNSGHYSQDALSHSQFHLHWYCGLNLAFPTIEQRSPYFVMTNLIGTSERPFEIASNLSGRLHWYGKTANRIGRKMGHLNYTGNSTKIVAQAKQERKKLKQ